MLNKTLTGLITGALLTAPLAATAADDHLYLGTNLGYMIWDDERFLNNDDEDSGLFGLNLGYEFAEKYAVELSGSTTLGSPDGELIALSLYNFFGDREDWAPYWVAGLSYSDMDEPSVRVTEALSAHLGLGASKFLNDQWEFRGDARAYKALSSDGNIGDAVDTLVDLGINLSLNYHFGDRAKPMPAPVAAPAPRPVAAPAPRPAPAPVMETKVVTVQLSVQFNTNLDSAIVYGNEIVEIAEAMKANRDLKLELEGHTDSRGDATYNQNLSQRRAETVKAKLVNDYGIAASRIKATGYGEARPTADNNISAGRAANRRVLGVLSWKEIVQ